MDKSEEKKDSGATSGEGANQIDSSNSNNKAEAGAKGAEGVKQSLTDE